MYTLINFQLIKPRASSIFPPTQTNASFLQGLGFHVHVKGLTRSAIWVQINCPHSRRCTLLITAGLHWPKRLPRQRKFLTCADFGHPLALTLVELKFSTQVDAIFHRLATQRKSIQIHRKSTVYASKFATSVNL